MKKWIKIILFTIIVGVIFVFGINFYVVLSSKNRIITVEEAKNIQNIDCILVLGAGIWDDKPSPMLEDRLLEGIRLYNEGVSNKLLMSGDHGQHGYDEVSVMKNYALEKGISSTDVFMDHAGFSTYESVYRAKEIFEAKKVLIVTQEYHLYRALYIAKKLGLEAYGVASNPRSYGGQFYREVREILARDKDFVQSLLKLKPTYLGKTIPVSGNGDITNDEEYSEDTY